MQIRALRPDEWPLYREMRLRGLLADPDAFGETHEWAAALADDEWAAPFRERASYTTWLAACTEAGTLCGILRVSVPPDEPATAQVNDMWVDPEQRGRGLGAALLDAALRVARLRGATRAGLGVAENNDHAIRLYERAGFAFDGEPVPLREGSPLRARYMVKPLA
jgi:ribosomal protein S18 acetylase RimI-like enzyme